MLQALSFAGTLNKSCVIVKCLKWRSYNLTSHLSCQGFLCNKEKTESSKFPDWKLLVLAFNSTVTSKIGKHTSSVHCYRSDKT